jgi:hypothetical protein
MHIARPESKRAPTEMHRGIGRVHTCDGKYRLDKAGSHPQISRQGSQCERHRQRLRKDHPRTMLHEFLESKRTEIIARTKAKVATRAVPRATEIELTSGVPLFVDQLIDTLKRSRLRSDEMDASATKHGNEMLRMGFSVGQVVHDYGDVCQAVTELAFELDAQITVDEFHTLNRCLDDAIAQAVTEYERLREQTLVDRGTERMGALAHELRNRLSTAMLSFGILKSGTVTIHDSSVRSSPLPSGMFRSVTTKSTTCVSTIVERFPRRTSHQGNGVQWLEQLR